MRPPGNEISPAWRRMSAGRLVNTAVQPAALLVEGDQHRRLHGAGRASSRRSRPDRAAARPDGSRSRLNLAQRCEYTGHGRAADRRLPERLHSRRGAAGARAATRSRPVLNAIADRFDLVVATRDWHPPDHGSFAGVEVDPGEVGGHRPAGDLASRTACRTRPAPSCIPSLDRSQRRCGRRQGPGPEHAGLLALSRRQPRGRAARAGRGPRVTWPAWRPTTA